MFENRQKLLKTELCDKFLTYISKRGKEKKILKMQMKQQKLDLPLCFVKNMNMQSVVLE